MTMRGARQSTEVGGVQRSCGGCNDGRCKAMRGMQLVLYVLLRVLQSSSGFNSCTKKQKRLMVVWLGFAGGGVSKEKKNKKSKAHQRRVD
ncbi:hypothetical protein Q3G72_016995 [Acer saccharum]|nr:hypothetical protein Q3G72_016995 [Acer saccharum]